MIGEMEILWMWFGCVATSLAIGINKQRAFEGFGAGLLFGPIGLLYMIGCPFGQNRCSYCAGWIRNDAKACHHCTREIGAK